MGYIEDFRKFAINNTKVSGSLMNSFETQNSLTPYILEEREMRVTQMDIFSRMMRDRILWVSGVVNDQMSSIVAAQLMYLDNLDSSSDITLHVDTPGGSVKSGLTIVDMMDYVACDISTVNTGMAASMGSVLLGAGTKGKRYTLKHSKVMLHQVSYGSGRSTHVDDATISHEEALKYNKILIDLLANYCDKPYDKLKLDVKRDFWLNSEEALNYGIIDEIITTKKK